MCQIRLRCKSVAESRIVQGEEGKCQGLGNSETPGSCWLHLDIGDVGSVSVTTASLYFELGLLSMDIRCTA